MSHPISQTAALPKALQGAAENSGALLSRLQQRVARKTVRRRLVRYGLLAVNVVLLAGIVLFVARDSSSGQSQAALTKAAADSSSATAAPLDQLSSADIAVTLSRMTGMAEATAITNQADSEKAELAVTAADSAVVSKPQEAAISLKSRQDIQTYVAQAGDTATSIGAKFGVSANSIEWSNGLASDAVAAGTRLAIPPIDGIVYTVKSGDTAASLAQKFSAAQDQITTFNDAEIAGLQPGEQIVIPNGQQPAPTVRAASYAAATSYWGGGTAQYGANGYDFGYCTYWVALRRSQVGEPLPSNLGNASSWGFLARAYGMSTGTRPQTYAAAVTSTVGAGHVVFVESVNADGSINISEMNHVGWDVVDHRTIPAAEAATYTYIY